jgi:hypothetical protein
MAAAHRDLRRQVLGHGRIAHGVNAAFRNTCHGGKISRDALRHRAYLICSGKE